MNLNTTNNSFSQPDILLYLYTRRRIRYMRRARVHASKNPLWIMSKRQNDWR